jgi:quercetin dioxygenase-like cupin family protein
VSTPTVIRPGGGEVIGDAPDRRVEILSDPDEMHATWSRFGPRRDGADLHIHHHHTDIFYVLEGELTVRLGPEDESVLVPAGTLARVPPLVVHGFRNGSDADVRYLNFHAPGLGFADYMRGLRDGRAIDFDQAPPDGSRPAAEAVIGGTGFEAGAPGMRAALLADVDEIGIAEVWSDPGAPSPAHVHRRHVESFYVLAGELALTAGGRELRAAAGSWVQLPPGVPHAFSVPGPEPVRVLNLHAPNCGFGAFLRELADTRDEQLAAERAGFDQLPA